MEIGIAYDLRSDFADGRGPEDRLEEYEAPETVDAIAAALESRGYRARRLGGGRALLQELLEQPPDLVFNLAEGAGSRSREAHVPAVCELLGVPYTHSDPLTMAVTLDKAFANRLVASAGIRTPRGQVVESPDATVRLDFPIIAKPIAEGSSIGLRVTSRVDSAGELRLHLERLLRDYRQPVLLEEFCPGAEFTVGIVGTGESAEAIGVMELVPRALPLERFVYSVEMKRAGPADVDYFCPPRRAQRLLTALEEIALAAYRVLGCRDIGRVDLRLDAEGEPCFLEVNPLPGLQPWWGDLVLLAEARGFGYEELIGTIVRRARERQGL